MRIRTASPTLTALVAIAMAAALGHSDRLRAEPITIPMVEPTVELSTGSSSASEDFDVQTPSPGNGESTTRIAPLAKAAPGLSAQDRHRPRAGQADESLIPEESAVSPAMIELLAEDRTWDREFKEALRPLYEELVDSGMMDAVADLKHYLRLSPGSSFDAPLSTGRGAAPESASWGVPTDPLDADDNQPSAGQIEKEKLIISIMINELIESIKPWLFGLAALYALWLITKLALDYSHWRSRRALKRGSPRRRSHRTRPTAEPSKAQLPRRGHRSR